MSQPDQREITKEEFVEWCDNDVTKFVLDTLTTQVGHYIDIVRARVRDGDLTGASFYEGLIAGNNNLLLIDYEDVSDES